MKRTFKLMTVLLMLIILCGIVTLSAMASGDESASGPADGYYFQVYTPSTGTVTKYTDPSSFDTAIKNAADGSIITLLWNVEDVNTGMISISGPKTLYWDLNGYYYSFILNGSGGTVSFDVKSNVELNVYSSRPGGRIFNSCTQGATKPNALFYVRHTNCTLNLGEVTLNKTYNYTSLTATSTANVFTGVTSTSTPITYDGDNLSTYSSALVGLVTNSGYDKNINVSINGGTYVQSPDASANLISFTTNTTTQSTLTANNASFVSLYKKLLNVTSAATGSSTFTNCNFYSTYSLFNNAPSSKHSATFNGCAFLVPGSISGNVTLSSCTSSSSSVFPSGTSLALVNKPGNITLDTYEFTYNSDGSVAASSYVQASSEAIALTRLLAQVNSSGEYTSVTWNAEEILGTGEVVTENWKLGETPVSPIQIPVGTAAYRYEFEGVGALTDTSPRTYTLNLLFNFDLKANLTVYDEFKFLLYLPADIWEEVVSTKIDGVSKAAEQTTIGDDAYYVISHTVKAREAKEEFILAVELLYNDTTLTKEYTLSIPDYFNKVQEGDCTPQAQSFIDAAENYINAVYNYVNGESNAIDTSYVPTKEGTADGRFTGLNIDLSLTDSIVFEFTADTATDMRFMIPAMENGTFTYITVNAGTVTSYGLMIPIRFLNEGIIVEAEGKRAIYYIDDYINEKADDTNQSLVALTKAVGAYAKAAKDYAVSENEGAPVVNFSVAGEAINKIVYNSEAARAAAEALATAMAYKGHTVTLTLDTTMAATQNAIRISLVEPTSEYDYKISVDGSNLVINTGFASFIDEATDNFILDNVALASGNVNFAAGFTQTYTTDRIYYSDFGAIGDGVTDDFFKIKAAHDFANPTKKYTVCADAGKTYYIHETRRNGTGNPWTITIKTNVNWTGAEFIIDDTDISAFDGTSRGTRAIFQVLPDTSVQTITDQATLNSVLAAGLNKQTTRIDLGIGEAVMIIPYNSSHKVYRHRGYSDYNGGDMHEVILIDEYGNVDPETPVMFDYASLTKIDVYYLSDPITIEGGEFTTRASHIDITYQENGSTKYHDGNMSRGFSITRSNVTFKNVRHYVTGEISLNEQASGMVGPAYSGFFTVSNATHVTLDGCVMTGRRCYEKSTGGTSGTYDLSAIRVNKLVLQNCTQSNFWILIDEDGNIIPATENTPGVQLSMGTSEITGKKMHWGLGGSQYCKNMEYIDSTISRFDAHCGLYNGKIINSTVNYIALTGGGEMIIENSRWFAEEDNYASNSLIHLREDYGSTWDGTVRIDGLEAYIFTKGTSENGYSGTQTWLVMHRYTNWYFGYQSCFPSLEINNLDYYDLATREPLPAGFEIRLSNAGLIRSTSGTWYNEWKMHLSTTKQTNPYRASSNKNGTLDTTSYENLNPVKPPEIIKITGNDGVNGSGGYVFRVQKTHGQGISDGGYYDTLENNGGFFGDTKFYYGDGANDYYLGTNYVGQNTNTFIFK